MGVARGGVIDKRREAQVAENYRKALAIRTPGVQQKVVNLSGGNQQKVVLSKCLFADADLLMLDEPTRGVDVGAKSEIYAIIRQLSAAGKSILIFSSELPEIVNLCDTICLLYDGSMKAVLRNGPEIDSEQILHIVTGGE
jgi:ABC-type sugar transport system ATPase subunit